LLRIELSMRSGWLIWSCGVIVGGIVAMQSHKWLLGILLISMGLAGVVYLGFERRKP
jgi:hypothetical protein